MTERSGQCLCGAIRYTLKGAPRAITACHCSHCQKQSGSVFSLNLVMRDTDFEATGETRVFVDTGDSGDPVMRHFCGSCGSPIYATIAAAPGKIVLKAGTLDDLAGLRPQTEIYTEHAVDWLEPIAGTKRYSRHI
ncbi:GFA family protein [Stappia indica]|uniref:GFA family protein n=1 Tax=Stappia indica TaxID=538381 RepID=UPI001CD77831|nr:GFA family protein [Stappia indica]MCA1300624.1 GFA family protein [Stappia indica]